MRDTLAAGAGLCDEAVVRELVAEAPTSIRYLMRLGAAFDPGVDGAGPALTREGGHSRNRIVHAGGDRSGAEVQRTLDESALAAGVDVLDGPSPSISCPASARAAARPPASPSRRSGRVAPSSRWASSRRGRGLATGGYGQIFASTSNPPAVTGDGAAIALRAGLAVRDVEFVQFHPTVMWRAPTPPASNRSSARPFAVRARSSTTRPGARDGGRSPSGRPRATRRRGRRHQPAHGGARRRASTTTSSSTPRTWARGSTTASRRSPGVPRDRHRSSRRPHPRRPGGPLRVRRGARPPRRHDVAPRTLRRR